jgi:hypothetical protein
LTAIVRRQQLQTLRRARDTITRMAILVLFCSSEMFFTSSDAYLKPVICSTFSISGVHPCHIIRCFALQMPYTNAQIPFRYLRAVPEVFKRSIGFTVELHEYIVQISTTCGDHYLRLFLKPKPFQHRYANQRVFQSMVHTVLDLPFPRSCLLLIRMIGLHH